MILLECEREGGELSLYKHVKMIDCLWYSLVSDS